MIDKKSGSNFFPPNFRRNPVCSDGPSPISMELKKLVATRRTVRPLRAIVSTSYLARLIWKNALPVESGQWYRKFNPDALSLILADDRSLLILVDSLPDVRNMRKIIYFRLERWKMQGKFNLIFFILFYPLIDVENQNNVAFTLLIFYLYFYFYFHLVINSTFQF